MYNKEQAEEHFKDIQAAYQQIMKERTQGPGSSYQDHNYGGFNNQSGYGPFGGFGGFYGGYSQGQNAGYENDSHLRAAGNYIRSGYYKEARTVLDGMGTQERSAKWYYYSAIANSGLGNNVAALEHARKAAALEPNNMEYRNLVSNFENGGTWYQH